MLLQRMRVLGANGLGYLSVFLTLSLPRRKLRLCILRAIENAERHCISMRSGTQDGDSTF
jgi:hypothetical protein